MTISATDERRIGTVRTDDRSLTVHLVDGRELSVPLDWHPRLLNASQEQCDDWRLIGGGVGVHWPQVDEDLSLDGMLREIRSPAPRRGPSSPSAWMHEEQYLRQAQDFFGQSMGRIKGQMQSDGAQLQGYMQQLPPDAQAQVQEMTDSYRQFEGTIDQAAQDAGVQDTLDEAAQQAREQADQAQQVVEQAQGVAGQATQQVQDTVGGLAGQDTDQVGDQAHDTSQNVQRA